MSHGKTLKLLPYTQHIYTLVRMLSDFVLLGRLIPLWMPDADLHLGGQDFAFHSSFRFHLTMDTLALD